MISLKNRRNRQSIAVTDHTLSPFRVWPQDLDMNFHMNNGRYLSLMDLARFDFMGRVGILQPVLKNKWMPLLGAVKIEYYKSFKLFQLFSIRTSIECWDEKWFVMAQDFIADNMIYARATIRGLLRGRHGNIAPEKVFVAAGLDTIPSPMPSATTQLWLETLALSKK